MDDLVSHYHERPYKMKKYKSRRGENSEEQGRKLEYSVFPLLTMLEIESKEKADVEVVTL